MLQVRTLSEDLEIISDRFAFSCRASDRAAGLVGTRDGALALHKSLPITRMTWRVQTQAKEWSHGDIQFLADLQVWMARRGIQGGGVGLFVKQHAPCTSIIRS